MKLWGSPEYDDRHAIKTPPTLRILLVDKGVPSWYWSSFDAITLEEWKEGKGNA